MSSAIALFASARRHGNTGALMDRIASELDIEVVDLGALAIAPYDYKHGHRGDDFEPLFRRVLDYENVIFASPVYCYAVAPPMKAFFDRITDFLDLPQALQDEARRLRGKAAYVVCTSIYDAPPPSFIRAFSATTSSTSACASAASGTSIAATATNRRAMTALRRHSRAC